MRFMLARRNALSFTASGTISRHMGLHHNFDDTKIHFFALENVPPNERGGDNDMILLQHEALWISDLAALRPPGLNDTLTFKPFL